MNMRKKIKERVKKSRGYLTAERLAFSLRTDVRTIKKLLYEMDKTGEIKLTTWEKILHAGK